MAITTTQALHYTAPANPHFTVVCATVRSQEGVFNWYHLHVRGVYVAMLGNCPVQATRDCDQAAIGKGLSRSETLYVRQLLAKAA